MDSKILLKPLDIQERRQLTDFEDQLIDVLVVLDSTSDTISSLRDKYKDFCREMMVSFKQQADYFDDVGYALQEKQREVLLYRKQVEALHKKVQGTMTLVRVLTPFLVRALNNWVM